MDDAQVVRHRVQVRDRVRQPVAARAVLRPGARAAHQLRRAGREREFLPFHKRVRAILPVALHQLRLVVEQVEIGRRAREVKIDHALRLRREMGQARRQRIRRRERRRVGVAPEQRAEGDRAEPRRRLLQKMAARAVLQGREIGMHGGKDAAYGFMSNSSRFSSTLPTTVQAAVAATSAPSGNGPSGFVATASAWAASPSKRRSVRV